MKYLTGIHALNIACNLETTGDWHASSLFWDDSHLWIKESEQSLWGDYGIELTKKKIPEHTENYYVANHIRALLDLIQVSKFSIAEGMNRDYIGNKKYDKEIFQKVFMLKSTENWNYIDRFMRKEYKSKWLQFTENPQNLMIGENNTEM